MLKKRLKNPVFLIYVLVVYITLQFSSWLYLIFSLYNKTYSSLAVLTQKKWMLLGEGSVFFIILILGVLVILRAFAKERELAQEQENFVLSVTHELKTPISSVKLFLQTLQKHELPEEKKEEIYANSITEINRLDSLVNNLLLTRSIENNNYFLNKTDLKLNELIEQKTNLLKSSILKNHTVILNLAAVSYSMDRLGFESILVNLLENAAKYSPKNSKITIELSEKPSVITIKVMDEGIGISNEKKERVFTKFYREENEMTRKSKGTGLGLFITKFLVKKHKGKITLSDNEPKGLIVTITLKK